MRRLGLVFSAIVLVATMSFGQSKKVNLVSDINFEKLSNYLQLKPSQMNEVASINEFFQRAIGRSFTCKRKSLRQESSPGCVQQPEVDERNSF